MHGTNIVVGANGFVANQFENRKEFDARNTRKFSFIFMIWLLVCLLVTFFHLCATLSLRFLSFYGFLFCFTTFFTEQIQNSGWAYVYYLNENKTEYVLDAEIDSPVGNNSYFGVSVGIYENSVIVGADGFRKSFFLKIFLDFNCV